VEFVDPEEIRREYQHQIIDENQSREDLGCHILSVTKTSQIVRTFAFGHVPRVMKSVAKGIEKILIVQGLPLLQSAVVLSHEIGHIIISYEGFCMDHRTEEGICQLITYLWLMKLGQIQQQQADDISFSLPEILHYIEKIETNPSPTFGDSFREALELVISHRTFAEVMKSNQEPSPPIEVQKPETEGFYALGLASMLVMGGINFGLNSVSRTNLIPILCDSISFQ